MALSWKRQLVDRAKPGGQTYLLKIPPALSRRLSNPNFYSQGISNYDSLALLRLLYFHAIQERPMHREVDFMATLHPSLSMSAAHCIAGRGK